MQGRIGVGKLCVIQNMMHLVTRVWVHYSPSRFPVPVIIAIAMPIICVPKCSIFVLFYFHHLPVKILGLVHSSKEYN
jgi:hypothetical protein